jgi:hypothetical protein
MPASRKHRTVVAAALGTLLMILASASLFAAYDRNTTGLPTYPHISRAIMDPVPRDTLGSKCIHYTADSPDRLDSVEAWYRRALPGAVESDVNQNSLYGDFFKLDGIRLTLGTDFVAVYRTGNGRLTSIELFKCAGRGS